MSTMKAYKRRLLEEAELRQHGTTVLYDRVRLLVSVFDDQEFRDELDLDDVQASEWLDKKVNDTCTTFGVLRRVFEVFPDKEHWTTRNIRTLIAEVRDYDKTTRRAAQDKPVARQRTTAEDYRRLKQECERLKKELAKAQAENENLVRRLAVAEHKLKDAQSQLTPVGV